MPDCSKDAIFDHKIPNILFPTTATTESSAVASARAAAVLAGDDPSRLNSEQLRNLQQEENNENSENMLNRKQSWLALIKIIIKNLAKFYLRSLKHNLKYEMTKNEKN